MARSHFLRNLIFSFMNLPNRNHRVMSETESYSFAASERNSLRVVTKDKSVEVIVNELLQQARRMKRDEEVAQYLVGAKLMLRFIREIPGQQGDKSEKRSFEEDFVRFGDFEFEGSIIQVKLDLPHARYLQQIEDVLEHTDLEVWILTRGDRVSTWKVETSERFVPQQLARVVITSVGSFVEQSITELGEFSVAGKDKRSSKGS